jgi:hypothetical protein
MAKKKIIQEQPSKVASETLDQKYAHQIESFKSKDKKIGAKRKEITILKKEIEELDKKIKLENLETDVLGVSDNFVKKFQKEEKIKELTKEISRLETKEDEIEYLLNTCKLISDYSRLEDEEKLITQNMMNGSDSNLEGDLFSISKSKTDILYEYTTICEADNLTYIKQLQNRDDHFCPKCNDDLLLCEGFLTCIGCGYSKSTLHLSETPSYKELQEYDYKPQFTYSKSSHLDDWIRRFQAKEAMEIPQEILDTVVLEARKERLTDMKLLTEEKVKKYLKKSGYNRYYDHIVHIIHRLNGIPPLRLTPEIEDKIRQMFLQIQEPFEKYKPKTRKNFLSYSYTLHKFFQILGLDEYTKYFTLLKSPDKLRQQDEIFKKIVAEMAEKDKTIRWVFIPSI